jgi:hypothetical protein
VFSVRTVCEMWFCEKVSETFSYKISQGIHELIEKVRSTESLTDKKPARKCSVLTEEILHEIGVRLEHTPQRSLT